MAASGAGWVIQAAYPILPVWCARRRRTQVPGVSGHWGGASCMVAGAVKPQGGLRAPAAAQAVTKAFGRMPLECLGTTA
jgi:hypothetical protein